MKISKFTDNLTKKPGLFDFYFLFLQKIHRKSFKIFFVIACIVAIFLGYAPKIISTVPNTTITPELAQSFFFIFIFAISFICYIVVMFLINISSTETVEEKNSRAMEIIISSLPAKKHMFARIASNIFWLFSLLLIFILINFIATLIFCQKADGIFDALKKVSAISTNASVFDIYKSAGFKGNFISFILFSAIILFITSFIFLSFAVSLSSIPSSAQDSQYLMLPLILIPIISFASFSSVISSKNHVLQGIMGLIPLVNLCYFPSAFIFGSFFHSSFDPYIIFLIALLINLVFYYLVSFPLSAIYQQGILNYSQKAAWTQFKEVVRNLKYRKD